ncbi:glycosyltransferase family 4 protein [Dechloromonas sp. XY25]|uniref:Glycosyltransferase family 4 protein n=1 Tax=Dechloromonas hankyongensis TaxID=2908002 RepID=A0ABS9K1Q7_9RHOO|nr:glycosyltransferase family 4 protein [Dechloromonas hankyongensis]MCG2577111.1 glycosyltransferase family 4 protein [Dechloromonas hankyongensis]
MKFLLIAGFAESILQFRGPLILSLQKKGLEVHVAAPQLTSNSPVGSRLMELGVVVHDIPLRRTGMNPFADFYALWGLLCLMCDISPDYVMSYTVKPVIYGSIAAFLTRVPRRFALITGLGYAFQGEGQRRLLRLVVEGMYRQALRCVNHVFFQNPDDEALFRARRILAGEQKSVVVNGSGIDIAEFSVVTPSAQPNFLLIARLLGDKGVREYAGAAAILKSKYPGSKFVLVGWIDDNPDAIRKEELEQWVAAGTLTYLGRMNDVRPAIAEAGVYVLPSYREGTPRTVLEAMAMGRAIVTTDAPGCRETVAEGENGFLVPVKSVDGLVSAMERFILEPKLALAMGKRSREIACEKFDVNKVNAAMLAEMGIA